MFVGPWEKNWPEQRFILYLRLKRHKIYIYTIENILDTSVTFIQFCLTKRDIRGIIGLMFEGI